MTDAPISKTVRYDRDSHRIQHGEDVVAMAMRLTNDRWILTDINDRRIGKATYATPKEVAAAFDAIEAGKRT